MGGISSRWERLSPRLLRALIVAGLLGANLFMLALSGYSLQQTHLQHELRAEVLTQTMAQAIDASLSNSIEKIDLGLQAITDELERQVAGNGVEPERIGKLLAKYQGLLPEVEAIRVSDAEGLVIFGKGVAPGERASWADRDYFVYLRDHPDAGLQVSKPRLGRISKRFIVGFSRRYNFPDGRFAGVVSAPVALDYLSRLLVRPDVGTKGTVVLRDADLGLIARYPALASGPASIIGNSAVSAELREVAASGAASATSHTKVGADGLERTLSLRRLKAAPMLIIVGLSRDDYLAEWRAEVVKAAAGIAGFALLSLFSGWLVLHLLDRVMAESARIRHGESQLRLAASVFTHAHEGIVICDADEVILEVNPTFSEITGYSREEVLGQTPRCLRSGLHDLDFYRAMWQTIGTAGHWEGEIWNRRKDGTAYAERLTISSVRDDADHVTHYIGTFTDISQAKKHQDELEHLAHYDALTHLPNRALLQDRLAQALAQAKRAGKVVAVCYVDLDGFKAINDDLGHDAGDIFLVEVAQRLKDMLRGGDTVARLGGDEFVLVLVGIANREEGEQAAARVLKVLAAPVQIGDQLRTVSGSLGIALFPDNGSDPDTLVRHADQAMYQAKQTGKNRYQVFDSSHDQRDREHREWVAGASQGLENEEFHLFYQPIVDMRLGRVLGFEGLLRWQHPEHGLLPAADFLPRLASSEAEFALGRWVLNEGMHQLKLWRGMGLTQTLSLNVSAHYLLASCFLDDLAGALSAYPGLEAHAIEIEVQETAAMEDLEAVIAIFHRCHELGVDITLDDFGVGHSSLSCFRRLPVDTLKVDQAFVHSVLGDAEDLAIVESVVSLTRAFNRKLVAEGIESVEVGMLLLNLGCNVGQGYGIARPMPAEEVPAWLAGFVPDASWSMPLTRFSREDLPLFMAELEHRSWVRQLGAWLDADPGAVLPPPLDGRHCRFGRWFFGYGQQRYGRHATFQRIGEIHDAVHVLGRELVQLRSQGRRSEARQRFGELVALRDQLVEQLAILQAEAIVERMESGLHGSR